MKLLQILKYGKAFTSDKFLATINRMGRNIMFARKAVMLYYCLRDEDTPKFVKGVIAGDVAVLAIAMKVANRYIKASHKEQAQKFVPIGSMD